MRRRRGTWLALVSAGVALLAAGVLTGGQLSPSGPGTVSVTVTAAAPEVEGATGGAPPRPPGDSPPARGRAGAVAAATTYLGALGGSALLDPAQLQRTLGSIASTAALRDLRRAYQQAALRAREQLGAGTTPKPVVIVRAAPVGYRVDHFSPDVATISVWRVGVVGSGATVEPQQSWRTETVSLVWEDGAWKVAALRSSPGPTPPLGTTPATASDLFTSIPQFEEFRAAVP